MDNIKLLDYKQVELDNNVEESWIQWMVKRREK